MRFGAHEHGVFSPALYHVDNPRWGEDFIAHRIAEHPHIAAEVKRLRDESSGRLPGS